MQSHSYAASPARWRGRVPEPDRAWCLCEPVSSYSGLLRRTSSCEVSAVPCVRPMSTGVVVCGSVRYPVSDGITRHTHSTVRGAAPLGGVASGAYVRSGHRWVARSYKARQAYRP